MSASIQPTGKKENAIGDDIGFVEHWDFSEANLSQDNRIRAITQVASICYQNPKALGSEALYNRLMAESIGLPSSSFEFVPVLLDPLKPEHAEILSGNESNVRKFGQSVNDGKYFLTNYRAIVYDYEEKPERFSCDIRLLFNTKEECSIIRENFNVFLFKVDLPTRSQMERHRVNWQELSRRYVSGKRVEFDFYVSEKISSVAVDFNGAGTISVDDYINIGVALYNQSLEQGAKPEEARRLIPQMVYTQMWGGFQPKQLENFFKLRINSHAQREIHMVADAMKGLVEASKAPILNVKEDTDEDSAQNLKP